MKGVSPRSAASLCASLFAEHRVILDRPRRVKCGDVQRDEPAVISRPRHLRAKLALGLFSHRNPRSELSALSDGRRGFAQVLA